MAITTTSVFAFATALLRACAREKIAVSLSAHTTGQDGKFCAQNARTRSKAFIRLGLGHHGMHTVASGRFITAPGAHIPRPRAGSSRHTDRIVGTSTSRQPYAISRRLSVHIRTRVCQFTIRVRVAAQRLDPRRHHRPGRARPARPESP